ncbi:adrenodoxin-like [Pseudophryne corroboree]|uniref:adrenodoxin-like n=1 Tax=Pseudophryne corroboree TaxID=495146 RepID=UPI003081ED39
MARRAPGLLRTLLKSHHGHRSFRNHAAIQAQPNYYVRGFTSSARCQDANSNTGTSEDNLTVNFINRDGETLTATAKEGESLLEVVIRHHLNIDGFGACEGTLACSTCHLIFDQKVFEQLSSIADEEMDMLDLSFGLTDTSRLGCQICMSKAFDGITVRVPTDVADVRRETTGKQSNQ